jgi:carbon-monoxide dehydrogenase small subunit
MSRVTLAVNGEIVQAEVAPRTHLADFLREDRLLTGTHLGCEHGICGACTLLIDGAPARSCIAFAVACDGADVRTIEGLEHDPVIVRLRAAFTAEHALQCGYCTPGMLITARDIVQRLPNADEARVRLELAGNLCRCTGYAGIVRAILRVLGEGISSAPPVAAALPALPLQPALRRTAAPYVPGGRDFSQTLRLAAPVAAVWSVVRDPHLVAACMPGARLESVEGDRLHGEVRAAFGPIETLFSGEGRIGFDDAERRAEIVGDGRDRRTGTRITGRVVMRLQELDAATTEAVVTIDYTLRGPLAQFARGVDPTARHPCCFGDIASCFAQPARFFQC